MNCPNCKRPMAPADESDIFAWCIKCRARYRQGKRMADAPVADFFHSKPRDRAGLQINAQNNTYLHRDN